MRSISFAILTCFVFAVSSSAQPPQTQKEPTQAEKIIQLTAEVAQLKVRVADQEQKIAQLEAAVKALQVSAVPEPIPPVTPQWYVSTNWLLIKPGMSRAQIVDVLGPPTRETTVLDTQTLYYTSDVRSATALSGTITLVGDRLTSMTPPAFEK